VLRLQTGAIDAFTFPPLFAQQLGLAKEAPHMTDVKWVPLVGGTVITLKPGSSCPKRSGRAPRVGTEGRPDARADIRRLGEDAVKRCRSAGSR
jgi:hypothetical protein